MRYIDKVVIHHSVTPRDLDFEKSIQSFNNNHKQRLHKTPGSLGYHISYHTVIGGSWEIKETRAIDEIGYHASNWSVNKTSIGICLTWSFDSEAPSDEQYNKLAEVIKDYEKRIWRKLSLHLHNEFASKTCPGRNFDLNKLQKIMNKPVKTDEDAIDAAFELAPKQLQDLFSDYSGKYGYDRKTAIIAIYRFLGLIIGDKADTQEQQEFKEESLRKLIIAMKESIK